jgi:hypothetical protein
VKFDVGKVGRDYLIALLLGMTILGSLALVVGVGRMILKLYFNTDSVALSRSLLVLLVETAALGAALYGVIRRQRWSYFLSLGIYVSLISILGYSLATLDQSNANLVWAVPKWVYVICIVQYGAAVGWLVLPSARAQFSPMMHK